MKKLLVSTLALALLFPYGQANAELLKNFKLGGQIDMQATSANNVKDFNTKTYDQIGDAQTRVMLHADWDLLDDVHAKVTLRKSDRNYGRGAAGTLNANANANSQPISGTGANGILDNTYVDQAYFKIDRLGGAVDATLGRQFYGNAGDLVIYYGPSDKALYGMPTASIDAARFDWANDMFGVTGLVGKTTGSAIGGTDAANVDIRGLTASCKVHEGMGAYVYQKVTHNSAAGGAVVSNDELWVAGLKGKYAMGGAWIKGEFAKNFGNNRPVAGLNPAAAGVNGNYTGWALLLDAGYKADVGMAALMPWAEFGVGSGGTGSNRAFQAISPDYRPGSIYGRFAVAAGGTSLGSAGTSLSVASNSLSDRRVLGLGVKATPSALNKLTAGLSAWDFHTASAADGVNGTPKTVAGVNSTAGNGHIGTEFDLDLEWKHSENVSLGAGIGDFLPGGAIKNANGAAGAGSSSARLAYTDVRVRF